MRGLLILAVWFAASRSAASPRTHTPIRSTDPAIIEAERLWTAAAQEHDVTRMRDDWDHVAEAFFAIAEAGKVTKDEQAAAARAGLVALENAASVVAVAKAPATRAKDSTEVPVPQPIPAREQQIIHFYDVYLRFDRTSPDALSALFQKAIVLHRYEHLEEAIPIFVDIADHHRDADVAGYAVNLALDSYNRLRAYDVLVAFAERVRADAKFLANKPDLAKVVASIHVQSVRKAAEAVERAAREHGDREAYDRCAEMYLGAAETPLAGDGDEVLYNAMVCFELAGSLDRMRAAAERLQKTYPASRLRRNMLARLAGAEAKVGRVAEAAAAAEKLAAAYPGDKESRDLLERAIEWRIALGELDRAGNDLDLLRKLWRQAHVVALEARLVDALLAAGRRADASRRAREMPALATAPRDGSVAPIVLARTLADAACPVALVDELCSRARDPSLVAQARAELRRIPTADVAADVAALLSLDLDLEPVLATRAHTTRDDLAEGYRALTAASHRPDTRIAAHARLARLARLAGHTDEAGAQLEQCITEGRASLAGASWIDTCERERATLKLPPVGDVLRERIPAPSAAPAGLVTAGYR